MIWFLGPIPLAFMIHPVVGVIVAAGFAGTVARLIR